MMFEGMEEIYAAYQGYAGYVGDFVNVTGALGAVVAALAAVANFFHTRRVEKLAAAPVAVRLVLEAAGRSVDLPLEMRRRDISRAELLGRLGMLPMREKGRRFSIRHLSSPAFMLGINEVVEGKTSTLVIPCSAEELDQFEL